MWDWLTHFVNSDFFTWGRILWVLGITLVVFLGSIVLVSILLVKLPANYFLESRERGMWVEQHPVIRWTLRIVKNLIGLVLLVVGVVFLFTPGQGVITILFGLILIDYPGKRRLERWLVSRPGVSRFINRLRARLPPKALARLATASLFRCSLP